MPLRLATRSGVSGASVRPSSRLSAICSHTHTSRCPSAGWRERWASSSSLSSDARKIQPKGRRVGPATRHPVSPIVLPSAAAVASARPAPGAAGASISGGDRSTSCQSRRASVAEAATCCSTEASCSAGPPRYSASSLTRQSHSQLSATARSHAPTTARSQSADPAAPATRSTRSPGGGKGHRCCRAGESSRTAPPLPSGAACHPHRPSVGASRPRPSANLRWSWSSCSAPREMISAASPLARCSCGRLSQPSGPWRVCPVSASGRLAPNTRSWSRGGKTPSSRPRLTSA
mmetsp:Transcript_5437/g.18070  ORF Transcript_5437/g.18070 Transcript_5437/m.18070 type:complete len:290 (+) Transcript_5437:588-1457(+)